MLIARIGIASRNGVMVSGVRVFPFIFFGGVSVRLEIGSFGWCMW